MSVTTIDRDELLERLLHHVKKAAANEAIDKVFLPLLEERDREIDRLHEWGWVTLDQCYTTELDKLVEENRSLRYQLASQARTHATRHKVWRAIARDRRHWKNKAKFEKERHLNWEARWEEVRAERDHARIMANGLAHEIETYPIGFGFYTEWETLPWSKQIPVTDA